MSSSNNNNIINTELEAAEETPISGSSSTRPQESEELPPEFENVPFKIIFKKLSIIHKSNTRGKMKAIVPTSYSRFSSWNQLSENKKTTVLEAWSSQSLEWKKQVIDLYKEQINQALVLGVAIAGNDGTRALQTNVNDRCRLLHIIHDPGNASILTQAHEPLNRTELDRSVEERYDAWGALADIFNDCEMYYYENVMYTIDEDTGAPISVSDFECANTLPCKDFNPADSTRPNRDGAWIKQQLRDMKSGFTIIFDNWSRSGNQDLEHPYLEFMNYIHGNNLCMYAFMLYGPERYKQLLPLMGKLMPEGAQADSGVDGMDVGMSSAHRVKKRSRTPTTTPLSSPPMLRIATEKSVLARDRMEVIINTINNAGILGIAEEKVAALRSEYLALLNGDYTSLKTD